MYADLKLLKSKGTLFAAGSRCVFETYLGMPMCSLRTDTKA